MICFLLLFPLLHLTILVLLEVFFTAAVIGFTSAWSKLRWAGLLLVGWRVCCVLSERQNNPAHIYWVVVVVGCALISPFRYLDSALLDRREFEVSDRLSGEERREVKERVSRDEAATDSILSDNIPIDDTPKGGTLKDTSPKQPSPTKACGNFWKRLSFGMKVVLSAHRF